MRNFIRSLLGSLCVLAGALTAQATTYSYQPTDTASDDGNYHDLNDLDHSNAYTWGITDSALKAQIAPGTNIKITSAVLTIKNLYNWDARDTNNQLFIHLLDNSYGAVKTIVDDPTDNGINQGVISDYFNGATSGNLVNGKYVAYGYANSATATQVATGATNTYLTKYHDYDGPTTQLSLYSYALTDAQLATLTSYILNGHTGGTSYADFGLGFDGDCHYFNDGIKFTIVTATIPPSDNSTPVPDGGNTLLMLGAALGLVVPWRRRLQARLSAAA